MATSSQRSASCSAVTSAKSTDVITVFAELQSAEPLLDAGVERLVVDGTALPAHAADESDGLHDAAVCHGEGVWARQLCPDPLRREYAYSTKGALYGLKEL